MSTIVPEERDGCHENDHFSVSQIENFAGRCPRNWWCVKVGGDKEPPTTATDFGKLCHDQMENYQAGQRDIEDCEKAVQALAKCEYLPKPLPRQKYALPPIPKDGSPWQNPNTGLWYTFNKFKTPEYIFLNGLWVAFDPMTHTKPNGTEDFVLEWHIDHKLGHIFELALEGFIDLWIPRGSKEPSSVLDYKFISDATFRDHAVSREQMYTNTQVLLYARYLWETFPDLYPDMVVGQLQVNKKTNQVRPVVVTLTKDACYHHTDKYRAIVSDMKRYLSIGDIADTETTAEFQGARVAPCFKYGKWCHVQGKCNNVGLKPMSETLLAHVMALRTGVDGSFMAPETASHLMPGTVLPLLPYPTKMGEVWTNPNTGYSYLNFGPNGVPQHFTAPDSKASAYGNDPTNSWAPFDPARDIRPDGSEPVRALPPPPAPVQAAALETNAVITTFAGDAINPPAHFPSPGYTPQAFVEEVRPETSAPAPSGKAKKPLVLSYPLSGLTYFPQRASKRLTEKGIVTLRDLCKYSEAELVGSSTSVLGDGPDNYWKGIQKALKFIGALEKLGNLTPEEQMETSSPDTAAVSLPAPEPTLTLPDLAPATPGANGVELSLVAPGIVVRVNPGQTVKTVRRSPEESSTHCVNVTHPQPDAVKPGDPCVYNWARIVFPVLPETASGWKQVRHVTGKIGQVLSYTNGIFEVKCEDGYVYEQPFYTLEELPMSSAPVQTPQNAELWTHPTNRYNYALVKDGIPTYISAPNSGASAVGTDISKNWVAFDSAKHLHMDGTDPLAVKPPPAPVQIASPAPVIPAAPAAPAAPASVAPPAPVQASVPAPVTPAAPSAPAPTQVAPSAPATNVPPPSAAIPFAMNVTNIATPAPAPETSKYLLNGGFGLSYGHVRFKDGTSLFPFKVELFDAYLRTLRQDVKAKTGKFPEDYEYGQGGKQMRSAAQRIPPTAGVVYEVLGVGDFAGAVLEEIRPDAFVSFGG